MIEIIKSIVVMLVMLALMLVWGNGTSKLCNIKTKNYAFKEILGLCSFFIVQQLVIVPMIYIRNDMKIIAMLDVIVVAFLSVFMLFLMKPEKIKLSLQNRLLASFGILATIGLMVVAFHMVYRGYDTTYYIGVMNSFVYDEKFWTRDGFRGLWPTDVIPLHYAISCFYPMWSIVAYITGIPVRILVMFATKGMLVVLFSCVGFCVGYELLGDEIKRDNHTKWVNRFNLGFAMVIFDAFLCLFLNEGHSIAGMLLMRGYESKGYCAAVICPFFLLLLVKLCRNPSDNAVWKILALVAWASIPIAMSSMAIIPLAIAIVGFILIVTERKFWPVFIRCLICVIPNLFMMAWYMLGK